MARYNIEAITSGDWDYAGDSYDLKRIVRDYLLPHLGYNPDELLMSDAYEKYWSEDEWQNCGHAPDSFKFTDDAPDYMMHIILNESPMWELTDSGRIKTLNKKMVLCAQADEGNEHLWLDQHEIGKCENHIYYSDTIKRIVIKCQATVYVEAKGNDQDNIMTNAVRYALENAISTDLIEDQIMEEYEYNADESFDKLNIRIHNVTLTPVRRMP